MGYVHIYTGNGKGKTTCALGLTLRALGAGMQIFFGQFMKKGETSEILGLRRFEPQIRIAQFGSGHFLKTGSTSEEAALAAAGLETAGAALASGAYDLMVLDEANNALHHQLLAVEAVLELIATRPARTELVLTGRNAPDALRAVADLVTEMTPLKHYFDHGVAARKGIEY